MKEVQSLEKFLYGPSNKHLIEPAVFLEDELHVAQTHLGRFEGKNDHISDIGPGSMGKNSDGDDGHTTFTFTNRAEADESMTVVV
ncbi:hypothetical protein MY5147_009157 [Beauveria neobassiana]